MVHAVAVAAHANASEVAGVVVENSSANLKIRHCDLDHVAVENARFAASNDVGLDERDSVGIA
jgi:hypothetical protein